jgi:hypothetical protein
VGGRLAAWTRTELKLQPTRPPGQQCDPWIFPISSRTSDPSPPVATNRIRLPASLFSLPISAAIAFDCFRSELKASAILSFTSFTTVATMSGVVASRSFVAIAPSRTSWRYAVWWLQTAVPLFREKEQ